MLGHAKPDAEDPFALLSPVAGIALAEPLEKESAEPVDVLEELKREADAALRDPNYVSPHAMAVAASAGPVSTQTDADPLQSLTHAGQSEGSLLEILEGPAIISRLADPVDSLEAHDLFATQRVPDVLRLFAGDIVPARRQDIAATLTRREHHLVSMDSAHRLAQAQEPERGS